MADDGDQPVRPPADGAQGNGHPIIELIEELVLLGGGYGLFTGCAAGDSAAATVLRVDVS